MGHGEKFGIELLAISVPGDLFSPVHVSFCEAGVRMCGETCRSIAKNHGSCCRPFSVDYAKIGSKFLLPPGFNRYSANILPGHELEIFRQSVTFSSDFRGLPIQQIIRIFALPPGATVSI